MIVYLLLLLITAFIAYTAGSISTQRVAGRYVFHKNLARLGTGNLWFSNFRRLYGVPGLLKLLLVEVVKDLVPILLGGLLLSIKGHGDVGRAFAAFCLMMGRLWPVFNEFRGCHGSIALIVAGFCLDASVGVAALAAVAAVTWFTRYLSLGAMLGAVLAVITLVLVEDNRLCLLLGIALCVMVLLRHIPALRRLLAKTEERLSFVQDITYKFDEKF